MRNKIIKQAVAWLGKKESDGSHKEIIDIYNTQKTLPRGYKLKYSDSWCAGFVTALAVKCGLTAIIPCECSCPYMINIAKARGIWKEADNYTPQPADLILYDWADSGYGDNVGTPDHIGVVEKVTANTITVIEGNYDNSVKRRKIEVNARYIRGYIVPLYTVETITPNTTSEKVNKPKEVKTVNIKMKVLSKGINDVQVKTLQTLLIGKGYSCGKAGVDGQFGEATKKAVESFQKAKKLTVDGIVGANTWNALVN